MSSRTHVRCSFALRGCASGTPREQPWLSVSLRLRIAVHLRNCGASRCCVRWPRGEPAASKLARGFRFEKHKAVHSRTRQTFLFENMDTETTAGGGGQV